jgi:hypothetical protein
MHEQPVVQSFEHRRQTGLRGRAWQILLATSYIECNLNSVSGLVSKTGLRLAFDQSELSNSKIPPTDWPKVRPGRDP